ncbi:hypothetical protein I0C86_20905 [Plantactinospora sp. S1510]|uniref:Serine-threonine protein kinase n=1 Tax=Plantactinospora alkalitolerans TaxID=2789879 RepID=A0ABS0GYX2_9ACTN|nr:hypothetical protein [Plantactinospora alkalitolerans]MBF9131402.1 hypothetical protein [Plantactinospora alkalitolerans]
MRFPYAEVEIESTGAIHDENQRRAASDLVAATGPTDVLVLCHGWNNDIPQARRLYLRLTDNMAAVRPAVPSAASRSLVVIGVLWPSIRWSDEDEVAGGGAGFGDEAAALTDAIAERIEDPTRAARLARLVPKLTGSAQARREFLDALREQVPTAPARLTSEVGAEDSGAEGRRASGSGAEDSGAEDSGAEVDEDPPPAALLAGDPEEVFAEAGGPEVDFGLPERSGGAAGFDVGPPEQRSAGGAAGFGFGLDDVLRRARGLLNITTYYTMKDRAGQVGSGGIAALLSALATTAPQARLHLAGHSFGARAVSAAAVRHPSLHSCTLLQAAFSHHAFAANFNGRGENGFFRPLLASRRLTGPMLITHTVNDRAVGLAYAAASRLARHAGAGLGDENDPYGGLGRNGALKTPEVVQPGGELLDVGGVYHFQAGRVHNLRADSFVRSHGDVGGQQTAYALLGAINSA